MQIVTVRLDQVQPHRHNIRRDVGDVTELADSFRTSGLVQPIVLAPRVGKGKKAGGYTLIAGHRRFAAAQLCQWTEIDAIVRDDLDTEAKQIETMAIENLQRLDLTPVEEARGYQQLLDLGYTPQKIAKQTGRNVKTVKLRIGLNKLSDKASDKLHAGQITIEQAEVLASFAKDPKVYAELEKSIGTSNFAWKVNDIKAKQKKAAARQKLIDQLRAEGVTRINTPTGYPWHSTVQPLYELADLIDPKDHADCEGHAAIVLDTYDGARVDYVCTDPAKYGHTTAVPQSSAAPARGASSADREAEPDAEFEARLQQQTDLRTAQVTRHEFVRQLLKRQRLAPAVELSLLRSALVRLFAVVQYDGAELGDLAELLRFDVATFTELQYDEQFEYFAAHVANQLDVTDMLKVLFALHFVDADPGAFSWGDDHIPAYFDLLAAAGYEISDVERAKLDTAHPAPAPAIEDVVPAGELAQAL